MTLLQLLALICLFFSATFADESVTAPVEGAAADFADEEGDLVVSSPDVTTAGLFPRYPNDELPLAVRLELLFALQNHGEHTFTVTRIRGSLRSSPDQTILQNFSSYFLGRQVGPQQTVSFTYWLDPDPLLEPKDYVIDAFVEYSDEDNYNFTSVAYNKTIYLVDGESEFELKTALSYLFGLAVAGAVAYAVLNVNDKSKTKSKPAKPTPVDNSWTSNRNLEQWKKATSKK